MKMIIKIIKDSDYITMIDTSKELVMEDCDNMLLLDRGINEIMYNLLLRNSIIEKYGINDEINIIIPNKITDTEYIVSLDKREIQLNELREEHSKYMKYSTINEGEVE